MKFSNKMDDDRVKKMEKTSLPETKRRRLFLKQERANQKDASEVSGWQLLSLRTYEHFIFYEKQMRTIFACIFLKIGLGAEADIETILDPVSKPTFGAVQKLKNTRPLFIIFDLETTGLSKLSPRIFKFIPWHIKYMYNMYYHWQNKYISNLFW